MDRIARVVSSKEIYDYFNSSQHNVFQYDDGSLSVNFSGIQIEISPQSLMFDVSIKSVDDPSDSDEMITDDPLEFITEFLSTGTYGDEFFQKMSSIQLSEDSYDEIHLNPIRIIKTASNNLNRIALKIHSTDIQEILFLAFRAASKQVLSNDKNFVEEEFNDLKTKINEKGWKVSRSKNQDNEESLIIDISGIYDVEISVHSISWSYSFILRGYKDTKEEGVVDDPIVAFKTWYKDNDISSIQAERISELESMKTMKTPKV